jgi:hypothetical protein
VAVKKLQAIQMEQQDHRVIAAHSALGWSAGERGRFEITKPFLECKNAVPTTEPQPLKAVVECAAVSPRKAPSVIKTKPLPTQKPVAKAKAPAPPKTLEKSLQPWQVSVRMAVFLLVALLAMTCAAFGSEDATSFASARGAQLVLHTNTTGDLDVLFCQHFVSNVAKLTAAVGNSAVDEILVAAGTYSFATDMCSGSTCIDCAVTARVAAAQEDLLTPYAPRAALCEDVVFGAEEQLCDESSTDPVIPRRRCHWQCTAPNGTYVLHVVRVVHVQPGQRCTALGARDVPQVDPGAVGAWRAVELPLATKLARRRRQFTEELCLVLSHGVPDEGGPVRIPEALAHPTPVPDAGLGLREQRAPPLGRALAAHARHCGARWAGTRCAPTETKERLRLSTFHGRVLHAHAKGILLAFRRVCIWTATCCFLVFAFVLCGAVFGLALDCTGHFSSGCAVIVARLLLGASDVDRHDARPLVQKLLTVSLVQKLLTVSFSCCAHSWRSSTVSRHSNASSKRVRLHVRCLIILAGFGSCGAQSSGPPSVPSPPGSMVVSTVMRTTTSDVALHRRHLNEASASTVGEFTAAIADSSTNKILLAAGTYELTSNMCTGSAICIDRALTIEAQVPGSVVLDAKGGRRVFEIQSAGMAELIGLNITGGSATMVQSVCLFEPFCDISSITLPP